MTFGAECQVDFHVFLALTCNLSLAHIGPWKDFTFQTRHTAFHLTVRYRYKQQLTKIWTFPFLSFLAVSRLKAQGPARSFT
jgi:hypothetical protein